MPQVSVIVPVYNAEKTLIRCLDSLVIQTLKDIEIILINDGSTDKSKYICEEYVMSHSNFLLINQENTGPASARNVGINRAKGKYISFVDADDFVENNMFESMFRCAEENMADMVICGFYEERKGKHIVHDFKYETGLYVNEEAYKIAVDLINDVSERRIPPYSWLRMVRKNVLENPPIRYADGMIRSEDYYYFVQVHFRIKRLYLLIDQPLYHYFELENSITHRYVRYYWKSVKQIYFGLRQTLPQNTDISSRLDLMLIQRSLVALNNSARIDEQKKFKKEVKEIIKDPELRLAVKKIDTRKNNMLFNSYYKLMKKRLTWIVYFRYLFKFCINRRNALKKEK